ncbi:MAG: hypothetical protein WCQ50_15390 [Spirochaetota bacterium]
MNTRYRGFKEEKLTRVSKEFEALGMMPSEIYAAMNLAGAKWRSVQRHNGRKDEAHEEEDGRVFQTAIRYVMQATMTETLQLGKLAHATEGERFMFLAISITLNRLFTRGPRRIREWLEEGEVEERKVLLSFAIGSCIIVADNSIDYFFARIVGFRYGSSFDSGNDIADAVLHVIGKIGISGSSILNPVTDEID